MNNGWTIQDDILTSQANDWTLGEQLDQNAEDLAWKVTASVLDPNVTENKFSHMGFAGWAAEEFAFLPELVDVIPEDTQADSDNWTIIRTEAD